MKYSLIPPVEDTLRGPRALRTPPEVMRATIEASTVERMRRNQTPSVLVYCTEG
jgi:hypothetical protein